ncbi:hypothetical protein BBJ28_00020512 [Nothophytophthora sp. Chile5]|nr:hypothetical protein BBJ28_00020512 [Nothophytophthora sp. Chile5]
MHLSVLARRVLRLQASPLLSAGSGVPRSNLQLRRPLRAFASTLRATGEFTDVLRFATIQPADGQLTPRSFRYKALLVVNTASKCGHTPQLKGLQTLHEKYHERGLVVLAVPSNDFGQQEPGDSDEIRAFYTSPTFQVSFPIAEKAVVTGEDAHPFFKRIVQQYSASVAPTYVSIWLETSREDGMGWLWNFDKFLLDHKGDMRAVFPHDTEPLVPELIAEIEELLDDLPRPLTADQEPEGDDDEDEDDDDEDDDDEDDEDEDDEDDEEDDDDDDEDGEDDEEDEASDRRK